MSKWLSGKHEQTRAAWENTEWDDIALFIGPNADRFRRVWEKAQDRMRVKGVGTAAGWSWPAFIFGFAWFLYRKQWAAGIALIVVPLVLGYFLKSAGGGGVAIVMAIYAKSFILQAAVGSIDKVKAAGGSAADIAAAGGVSRIGGAIGGVLWLLFVAAAVLAAIGRAAPG